MRPGTEDRPEDVDTSGSVVAALAAGIALVVAWPLAAGYLLPPVLAVHRWPWRRFGWRGRPALVALIVGTVLSVVLSVVLWGPWLAAVSSWPPDVDTARAIVAGWIVLAVPAVLVARVRLAYRATASRAGRVAPHRAGAVRRAIWSAADADAYAAAGWAIVRGQPFPLFTRHRVPATAGGRPALGAVVDDERRDLFTRAQDREARRSTAGHPWRSGPWLTLPSTPPRAVILGDSGSGKTTVIRRLTAAALADGWRVLVIDAKGDRDDAAELTGIARAAGVPWVSWPSQPFDLFRGDAAAAVRLALALLPHDGPQHYRDRDAGVLAAVSYRGPWRDCADVLERLRQPAAWVESSAVLAALTHRDHGVPVHRATHASMAAALAPLAAGISADGWGLDDLEAWRLAVVSLDAGSNPAAAVMGAAVLAAVDAYRLAVRTADAPPLLVIVDEAGVILDHPAAPPAAMLAEQVRSQRIGLVVAGQSVHSLGLQADRLLSSGATLVTLRQPDPEAIVTRLGTISAPEVAHQGQSGGAVGTGMTSTREQLQHALPPDRVRGLSPWRVVIGEPGRQPVHGVIPPLGHPLTP